MIPVLQSVLDALLQFLGVVFSGFNAALELFLPNDHRHKASFGEEYQYLSKHHAGFNVNGKSLSAEDSKRGLLLAGETGSGKTSGGLLKSCLFAPGSQIIHAPNTELFDYTAGYRARTDRIMIFAPTLPNYSLGFNPMLRANSLSEINRLSKLIITLFSSKSDAVSFWMIKAQELLTCLILVLKKCEQQYHTLPNVAMLLDMISSESSRPYVDSLFLDVADDWLFQKYESITSQSDTVFQGVVSSCQSAVQFFDLDDDIRSLVSHDELGDFEDIRKKRTSFYLISSTTKGDYYGPIMSILLDQLFENFFSRLPEDGDHDVYFHIDEAPVLKLDNLDTICANVRKHGGAICLVAQDPHSQLATVYGERKMESILANLKTKAYFSVSPQNAKRLESELGIYTYEDEHDEKKVKTRSLKTASELLLIPQGQVLITMSGQKPLLASFTPFYQDRKCIKAIEESEAVQIEPRELGDVPILPLKSMYPNSENL